MIDKSIYFNGIVGLLKDGVELEYEDWQIQEIYKSKNNIEYLLTNYGRIVHQHRGEVAFDLYDFQKRFIKTIQENNRVVGLVPRQSGKTSAIVGFCIHFIIFEKNKNIGILADRLQTSRKILATIKDMFKRLPLWIKPSVLEWNKTMIKFSNGIKIMADATSENSLVGESMSVLIVDEVAKINGNLFEDFSNSVMPTISSSPSAKIIMFSTSNGLNHFYKLWKNAQLKDNEWVPFEVKWNEIPGRDESFKHKIIKAHGENHWLQEYCNEFLGSSNSLISMTKLQSMPYETPIHKQYNDNFLIYELPIPDKKYYFICDSSEGLQQDFSTIQIFKYQDSKFIQAAVYKDNTSKPREFANIIHMISEYYNNALIIGESNSIGSEVLNELFSELENDNLYFDVNEKDKLGVKMTKSVKRLGCSYLKKFIENDQIIINDFDTINQLSTFISKNNSYEADSGCNDDLVTPLVILSYLINNELFAEWWVDKYNIRTMDTKVFQEDLLPFFINVDDDQYSFSNTDHHFDD